MKVALIAAVADDGTIGRHGALPWHLPADFRRFRALTMGHHLLMGRRTFASIGRPLAGRTTVVISRGRPPLPAGVLLAASLDEALAIAAAGGDDEVFVVGGAEIYRLALPRADRLYLTRVHAAVHGDVRFPDLDPADWRLVRSAEHPADERNALAMSFQDYERIRG